jgi:hypothetical protein
MVEKQWFGRHDGWTPHNSGSKIRICPTAISFPQTSAPKPDCYETYSSWILIWTIQNHPWGVSSKLGWLRSNGLAIMMVGLYLNSCSKVRICPAEFDTDLSTQTRMMVGPHLNPCSKSEFAQLSLTQTSAPKPDCCETYSSLILIWTFQNHPWGV